MTPEREHADTADAKLGAAEGQVSSWLVDADRPTLPDLVAFRKLLRSIRVHVSVVRDNS
jgi:hypothetical protein